MDPDCAICSRPAIDQCSCEAKGLDIAVRQAEQRMMAVVFSDIRAWVRGHAQDYILEYFSVLTTRRKDAHAQEIRRMTEVASYYYNARPHPSQISVADHELKRGIDEDWRASVQRYPEVLEYFYGLVELSLPRDDDPGVRDPPLSALGGGQRKVRLREAGGEDSRERRRAGPAGAASGDRRRVGTPAAAPPPPPNPPGTVVGGGKRASFAVPGYGYVAPGNY